MLVDSVVVFYHIYYTFLYTSYKGVGGLFDIICTCITINIGTNFCSQVPMVPGYGGRLFMY